MGIYERERKAKPNGLGDTVSYTVDTTADINSLPVGNGLEGSTALVIETAEVYVLGGNGWRKI